MSIETIYPIEQTNTPKPPEEIPVNDAIRLEIRHQGHALDLYKLIDQNRDFLAPMMPYVEDYTPQNAKNEVAKTIQNINDGKEAFYMIMSEGKVSGTISLYDRQDEEALMGFYLAEDATGKGVLTASAHALLDFTFNTWGLDSVVMSIRPDNEPSQNVAKRLGAIRQKEQVEKPDNSGVPRTFDIWKVSRP